MKQYLSELSQNLFSELNEHEVLSLSLHSEDSEFIRFNQARIRQNTDVHQHELTLDYRSSQRSYQATLNLTLDVSIDSLLCRQKLREIREQLPLVDENPHLAPVKNHGQSEVIKKSERPPTDEVCKKINSLFSDTDLAGFYSAGPLRKAALNSLGQFHYFENDNFFFDYSIYDGPKAVKGFYSDRQWNDERFSAQAQELKNTLALLRKPPVQVKPGQHRAYLAPMAVAEIVEIFNWRAVSRRAFEQGFAPLKKLAQKEQILSPHFSLIQNNSLGLSPHFNQQGEIVPEQLLVIENGELKNLLISSTTAQEYGLVSNQAGSYESMSSIEVRAGTLAEENALKELGTGLYLGNLHYINWSDPQAARLTGMTRFACFWVEKGEILGPIQDLRFDDTLYNIFGRELLQLTDRAHTFTSTSTYHKRTLGGMQVPGLLLNRMNFTL